MEIIQKEHETNTKVSNQSTDQYIGSGLFVYGLKLGLELCNVSQTIGRMPEEINHELVAFLSKILLESNEISVLVQLLEFYCKVID